MGGRTRKLRNQAKRIGVAPVVEVEKPAAKKKSKKKATKQ